MKKAITSLSALLVFAAGCASVAPQKMPKAVTQSQNRTIAAAGGGSTGGGGDLKSDFRKRAEALVKRLGQINDPLALEYAALFQKTLSHPDFKIDVVQTLIDPETQAPVPNQRPLYAYGAPLYIQLKAESKEDPDAMSWEAKVKSGKNLDVDVFHEMGWASGRNEDRDYQVSIGKLKLHVKKGMQRERLSLLKQDRYYTIPDEYAKCVYHVETDSDASILFITVSELSPSLVTSMECGALGFGHGRFEYNEDQDLWVQENGEKRNGRISILPDGNYLYYSVREDGGIQGMQFKAMALKSDQTVLVEADSTNRGSGTCKPFELLTDHDAGLAKVNQMLTQEAMVNAREKCERLFSSCSFKRVYRRQYQLYTSNRCAWIGVYEGKGPKL